MKSIKLMFLMAGIGMISITSCNSEMEQTKELKQSTTQKPPPELTLEESEAVEIITGEVFGTNTAEKRAKIICVEISVGNGGNVPTTASGCVNVNGNIYEVHYTSGYYVNGSEMMPVSIALLNSSCRC